jgi:hypothetical protein
MTILPDFTRCVRFNSMIRNRPYLSPLVSFYDHQSKHSIPAVYIRCHDLLSRQVTPPDTEMITISRTSESYQIAGCSTFIAFSRVGQANR